MNLSHTLFSCPLSWDGTNICTLVIESPRYYRKLASALIDQADGQDGAFVLSAGDTILEFGKHTELITDVLRVDPAANKRIVGAMIKELSAAALHEMPVELTALYEKINEMLSTLIFRTDVEATYQELNDISALLKLYDLRPDTTDCSLPEKLLMYMELAEKYLKKKLFILFHLHDALTSKELQDFIRDVVYRKLCVLLVETHDVPTCEGERKRIIDKDLCEIL